MKSGLEIENLSVEITRECNNNCKHCLRGEPQEGKNFKFEIFKKFLKENNIKSVMEITFTGGEPLLYIGKIEEAVSCLEECGVYFENCFIATSLNFTYVPGTLERLCFLADKFEDFTISLSDNIFTKPNINKETFRMFKKMKFFEARSGSDIDDERFLTTEGYRIGVIPSGNAIENQTEIKKTCKFLEYADYDKVYKYENIVIGNLFLTHEGRIVSDCNLSYDEIDRNEDVYLGTTKIEMEMIKDE